MSDNDDNSMPDFLKDLLDGKFEPKKRGINEVHDELAREIERLFETLRQTGRVKPD